MSLLNGKKSDFEHRPLREEFWSKLPEKFEDPVLSEIENRIAKMNRNYNLLNRRNRLLSAVAILENELNELQHEIDSV